jgi:hypothetical protein
MSERFRRIRRDRVLCPHGVAFPDEAATRADETLAVLSHARQGRAWELPDEIGDQIPEWG